ncbi:MAG: AbrB/MazE/SpoVT family DNA-binding domain-containing protein [Oscillospiraceae bacterium]|nr:AbrB/MazE/SpoVT family DNA-binding domain-containing protein [Oscillospiraceae bacterium]
MKAIGIVRSIDALGRIVIPVELRKKLYISVNDPLEIFVDDDKIILKKYQPACFFCHSAKDTIEYKNARICKECAIGLNEIAN